MREYLKVLVFHWWVKLGVGLFKWREVIVHTEKDVVLSITFSQSKRFADEVKKIGKIIQRDHL